MSDNPPTVAEEIVMALAVALHRKGVLDDDDVIEAAEWLSSKASNVGEDEAERLREAAHLMNCVILEAPAPSASEWNADKARARFRVISNDEGS